MSIAGSHSALGRRARATLALPESEHDFRPMHQNIRRLIDRIAHKEKRLRKIVEL